MSERTTAIDEMTLSGTKGKITVTTIAEPYGQNSESVVSIGISLKSDTSEPEWKVHIPKANIDQVIEALQKAKNTI
jgi:hypothetical protein